MSVDRWRWARRAHELRFSQLETVRRQAETWRTGLAGLTGLLGAALVVKGRDNVTDLDRAYQWAVVLLFGAALATLVTAALLALRAASGVPGDECLLTGEDLEDWSRREARAVQRAIARARWLTVAAITVLAVAVGLAWLAPVAGAEPLFEVRTRQGRYCGSFIGIEGGVFALRSTRHSPDRLVAVADVVTVRPVQACPNP